MSIKKLTKNAISLLKNLIETQSFSTEEENTALLIEAWFTENEIPFKRTKKQHLGNQQTF
jgi:acetylornithine deacetylase